jgi:hypothetical protein
MDGHETSLGLGVKSTAAQQVDSFGPPINASAHCAMCIGDAAWDFQINPPNKVMHRSALRPVIRDVGRIRFATINILLKGKYVPIVFPAGNIVIK